MLAERERFELSVRDYRTHDFQSCALDQLSHLSVPTRILYHTILDMSNDASPCGDMMFFASLKMMLLVSLAMMRCLPLCARRHTSLGEAVIIGHCPTSFAEGKHHSKNAPLSVDKSAFFVGGERGIRTLGTGLPHTRFPVVRLRPAQPSLHADQYIIPQLVLFVKRFFKFFLFNSNLTVACFFLAVRFPCFLQS